MVRLIFFVLLATMLLVADMRFHILGRIRGGIATALSPIQEAMLMPRNLASDILGYFATVKHLNNEKQILSAQNLALSIQAHEAQALKTENKYLRELLNLSQRWPLNTLAAEISYETRDPFTHKILIDQGALNKVQIGAPVLNQEGVIGQVTRVLPLHSEVTLSIDKDFAVPVQIARTNMRSVAYGGAGDGMLELRFVAMNADVRVGDVIVTSGLDGIYPAGLPVGQILKINRKTGLTFAQIICAPIQTQSHRQVMVLHYQKPVTLENKPAIDKPINKALSGLTIERFIKNIDRSSQPVLFSLSLA